MSTNEKISGPVYTLFGYALGVVSVLLLAKVTGRKAEYGVADSSDINTPQPDGQSAIPDDFATTPLIEDPS